MNDNVNSEKHKTCYKCNIHLEYKTTKFTYLDSEFSAQVLTCPKCGQVFLSQKQVLEEVHKIEGILEGK